MRFKCIIVEGTLSALFIKEEMKRMKPNVIANRKWLIIESREFKKVIMKLNTKNGDNIRDGWRNF